MIMETRDTVIQVGGDINLKTEELDVSINPESKAALSAVKKGGS